MMYERSDDLVCRWHSWSVLGPGALKVQLAPSNCTDMQGAIAVAQRLMPDVALISTWAGDEQDTIYRKELSGKWVAVGPRQEFAR